MHASDDHRRVATRLAPELITHGARAVLLSDSVVRGEHRPESDLDLLLILAEDRTPALEQRVIDGIAVDLLGRSVGGWQRRFARPGPSWLHAFAEAMPLIDDGSGAAAITYAETMITEFQTPIETKIEIAELFRHGAAKLQRAGSGPDGERGYWAAVCTPTLIDALYAVHDVPLAAGSRRLALLPRVPLTSYERAALTALLTGTATERLDAARNLTGHLTPLLD